MSATKFNWEVDTEAVNEACRMLGFKHAVKVRGKRGRRGASSGVYLGIDTWDSGRRYPNCHCEPTHFIAIDRRVNQELATETLWHEICHAYQMERYIEQCGGDIFAGRIENYRAYEAEVERVGAKNYDAFYKLPTEDYYQHSAEAEAYCYEQCAPFMSLVKLTPQGKARQERQQSIFTYGKATITVS
jgi:hypothetical protein